MSRLVAAMYDRMMARTEAACLGEWRAELLHDISGEVLEVGAGTGVNLPHYPRQLRRLVLSEPDPHMRRRLARKVSALSRQGLEVVDWSLEALPVPTASFDVVVAMLVLCSVPRLEEALAEVRRVLRPQGRLVFLEHVAAEDRPSRWKWQRRVEPLWRRVAGNCHLARQTGAAIGAAGFGLAQLRRESMRKAWPLVRPSIRGIAVRLPE